MSQSKVESSHVAMALTPILELSNADLAKDQQRSNPWEIQSQKEIYSSPWIKLREHKGLNPAKSPAIYTVVEFQNTALGICALDSEGFLYLVGQWRFALNQYSWEIPEGGGPIGLEPLVEAQRELQEEAGIIAARWEQILTMHLSNSSTDEKAIIYLARDLSFTRSAPEDTEQLEIRKVPLARAYELVEQGVITDAMSVAGILKLRLMNL